jgi:hypothetical protein
MTVEVLRAWEGGPLRQFSDDPKSGWSPYDGATFAKIVALSA